MSAETVLLAEIIQKAPSEASWIISSDSWEGIKGIFVHDLTIKKHQWIVGVRDDNRYDLKRKIELHDLGEKIVHMQLVSKDGIELMSSHDRMVIITISKLLGISVEFLKTITDTSDIDVYHK